jgi:mannosyl-3-phosphoglycerate phosphatase
MRKPVVFTDLDGTLLNEAYAFDSALPALALMEHHGIPLVICSSKTRSEIAFYRTRLNNNHPFISENGGGVFIPAGYFGQKVIIPENHRTTEADYEMITLGAQYADLRKALKALQKEGYAIKGFGDMSAEEVAQAMGLPIAEAELAKQRDFDEPFLYADREERIGKLFDSIKMKGLNVTKGRIYHLLGQSDKGKAVSMLIDLYKQEYGALTTVGLGDSPNDLPMLEAVDIPIVVQKADGTYDPSLTSKKLIKAKGVGPEGWNSIIKDLIPPLFLERHEKIIGKMNK